MTALHHPLHTSSKQEDAASIQSECPTLSHVLFDHVWNPGFVGHHVFKTAHCFHLEAVVGELLGNQSNLGELVHPSKFMLGFAYFLPRARIENLESKSAPN